MLAVVTIMLTYAFPISAMAWARVPASRFWTGAWADARENVRRPSSALVIAAGAVEEEIGIRARAETAGCLLNADSLIATLLMI